VGFASMACAGELSELAPLRHDILGRQHARRQRAAHRRSSRVAARGEERGELAARELSWRARRRGRPPAPAAAHVAPRSSAR
jgi:hypothetical protein